MCGVGDFVLRGSFVRYRLTVDAWRLLSAKQRSKAVAACFKLGQSVSTASDGGITVPNTPGGGKKPHQPKRKLAEKSHPKLFETRQIMLLLLSLYLINYC